MTPKEFFYLVAQMREAQKAYIKSRNTLVFRSCRALENDVDREIRRVREIINQQEIEGNENGKKNTDRP